VVDAKRFRKSKNVGGPPPNTIEVPNPPIGYKFHLTVEPTGNIVLDVGYPLDEKINKADIVRSFFLLYRLIGNGHFKQKIIEAVQKYGVETNSQIVANGITSCFETLTKPVIDPTMVFSKKE
jgi:hypothetical protein